MHGLSNSFLYTAKHIVSYWDTPKGEIYMEGTGFFVQKDDDIFLITNRHVAELPYAHPEYAGATLSEFLCKGYECMTAESLPEKYGTLKIANADKFVYHPNHLNDIACLKNPQCVMTSTTTSSISLPIPFSMLATEEQLNNKLCVCDRIAYPGFPEWYDKKNQTPIFRMGSIASDPRLGYSRQVGSPPVDRVAYEGFSSNGASGSPVFAIQKGFRLQVDETLIDEFYREVMLVGINAGHFPSDEGHSGISFFYKSSAIIDTINACK